MATVGCGGTLTDGAFPRTCALRLSDQTSYPQTHPELGTEEEDTGFPLATCPRSSVSQCSPIHSQGRSYFALPIHSVWAAPSSLLAWLTQRGEGNRVWGQALSLAPNVGLQVALDVPASSSHVSPGLYPLWALAPRAEKQCHCLPTAPRLCGWLQSRRSGAELWVMVYPSPPAPRKGSCSTFVLWQCVHRRVPWGALGTSISCPH